MKINQGMDRLRPWAKPEEEWYKVNVDSALHSATGRMGFGVILRVVRSVMKEAYLRSF